MQRSLSLPGPSPTARESGLSIPDRPSSNGFSSSPMRETVSQLASYMPAPKAWSPDGDVAKNVESLVGPILTMDRTEHTVPLSQSARSIDVLSQRTTDGYEPTTPRALVDPTQERAPVTLTELARLVRLSTYQDRRRIKHRGHLYKTLISTALATRLESCAQNAQKSLVNNYKAEDEKSFAVLYNCVDDIKKSCYALRQYNNLQPELSDEHPGSIPSDTRLPFLDAISASSRDVILNLLTKIRNDPDFVADRLVTFTALELSDITTFHPVPTESVLSGKTRGQPAGLNRGTSSTPSPVERLLSLQRHDPLSALLFTCFAGTANSNPSEHLRRTDIWASVCARLITENKTGKERFLNSVLNAWTSMRAWSGKRSLERYLMKILDDGAFLLEKAEDQAGTRIHVEPRNSKDSIAADTFYELAVEGLFEVINDGGIPEGLLELGCAIMSKVDLKRQHATRLFLVSQWLFSSFLRDAIAQPESCNMMLQNYITDYGRQKILKEVAVRAATIVVNLTWRKSTSISPVIEGYIESICTKFQPKPTKFPGPTHEPPNAASVSSNEPGSQLHLVLCPADIVTIVSALYPERRPCSSHDQNLPTHGLRSSASSISAFSGFSVPSTTSITQGFETASITSNPSSYGDTASCTPLFDDVSAKYLSSVSMSSMCQSPPPEDEATELWLAIRDMSRTLGADIVGGYCHPIADQWAVVFWTPLGLEPSTHVEFENHQDEESSSWEDDSNDETDKKLDLSEVYHLVREPVIQFLDTFEMTELIEMKASATTSIGTSKERMHMTKRDNRELQAHPGLSQSSSTAEVSRMNGGQNLAQFLHDQYELLDMLVAASAYYQGQHDPVQAHHFWTASKHLSQYLAYASIDEGHAALLSMFYVRHEAVLKAARIATESLDAWTRKLEQTGEHQAKTISVLFEDLKALRDKMWYVADVRNSSVYAQARDVACALKTMGTSRSALNHPRNMSRTSNSSFLLKTEAHVLELMAATADLGGRHKLSDEQAENTSRYISQFGIENFCKGEERIHRLCLEFQICIDKLVGESMMETPVLWSSDLYSKDKQALELGHQPGDIIAERGVLSIASDVSQDNLRRRSVRGVNAPLARTSTQDLRTTSARTTSQQSISSARQNVVGTNKHDFNLESLQRPGGQNPAHVVNSTNTFWSPLSSARHPSSMSIGSQRGNIFDNPGDTSASTDPGYSNRLVKQTFLNKLKETLTSLLLSDLGSLVFAHGSETDLWFAGDLGRECVARQQTRKPRLLGKKKSTEDLRASTLPTEQTSSDFSFKTAFRGLLQLFSLHPSPYTKLNALHDLEKLIVASFSVSSRKHFHQDRGIQLPKHRDPENSESEMPALVSAFKNRRLSTINQDQSSRADPRPRVRRNVRRQCLMTVSEDEIVCTLQDLFRDPTMLPKTLFRDLQFVAALVPSHVLNKSERGKAFWNVGLAALALKEDICRTIVDIADEVVSELTAQARPSTGLNQKEVTNIAFPLSNKEGNPSPAHTMASAAKMYTIAAREGLSVAERELAIFYLTHPELVERTLLPLTRPKDVFKAMLSGDAGWSAGWRESADRDERDRERSDPATMCVAYHWMELSAQGGDELAMKFMRQKEEIAGLP